MLWQSPYTTSVSSWPCLGPVSNCCGEWVVGWFGLARKKPSYRSLGARIASTSEMDADGLVCWIRSFLRPGAYPDMTMYSKASELKLKRPYTF